MEKKCPGELLYWRFNMLMFITPHLPKVSYSKWTKQQNRIKLAQLEEVCLCVKSWMLSPGNGWSCNMRILIFSVRQKMVLNQETPRTDKGRSELEGGSGYIISSDQEGWAKNWNRGDFCGRGSYNFRVAPESILRSPRASGQLRPPVLGTSYISVGT